MNHDISAGVSSTVKLYADDTKLYIEIESIPNDTHMLKSDWFRQQNDAKLGS